MEPERADRQYKCSSIVAQHCNDECKHHYAQVFFQKISDALDSEIKDETVSIADVVAACEDMIETLRVSAKLFVQEVFRINLGIEEPDDVDSLDQRRVSWFYAEYANYLNEHQNIITVAHLQWAGWKWNYEFESRIQIPNDLIQRLIDNLSSDKLLSIPRTTRLIGGYDVKMNEIAQLNEFERWQELKRGSDYLEFPEEYMFLVYYLESREMYKELEALLSKLNQLVLFDSMLYHIQYPETFRRLAESNAFFGIDYQLSLLNHWLRASMKVHCNMKMYESMDEQSHLNRELLQSAQNAAAEWFKTVTAFINEQIQVTIERIGYGNVSRWFFTRRWTNSNRDSLQTDAEQLFAGRIKEILYNGFDSSQIIVDFRNMDYLGFVAAECAPSKGLESKGFEILCKLYTNFLDSDNLYGNLELNEKSLMFLRGFANSIAYQSNSFLLNAQKLMNKYKVRNEGWSITDDIVKAVAREVILLSAIVLIYEIDDRLESEREELYQQVQARLLQQVRTCRYDFLQEKYLLPLQITELVNLQLRQKNSIKSFEQSLLRDLADIYLIIEVLGQNEHLSGATIQQLKKRWYDEKDGLQIIASQTRRKTQFEEADQWITQM